MKKTIILILLCVLLVALSVYAEPSSLTCIHDSTPLMLSSRNKIDWLCYTDSIDHVDCISYVSYNDSIIQVNPERIEVDEHGIIESFKGESGLVNVHFTNRDLRDNVTVEFGVKCGILIYAANVTPLFKDLDWLYYERGAYLVSNAPYIIFGVIAFIVIGIAVIFLYRRLRGQ